MAHRPNVTMHGLLAPMLAVWVLCSASSCDVTRTYSSPSFDGRVTERDTDRPIAGAIVAVRWGGTSRSFATGMFICLHTAQTTTDADGRYRLDGCKSRAPQLAVDSFHRDINAYKAGYGPRTVTSADVALAEATGTADERIRLPGDFAGRTECLEDGPEGRKLSVALHRRLLEDIEQAEASAAAKASEIQYFERRIDYREREGRE